jgi:hypothetical protein
MAVAPAEAETGGDATLLHWTSQWQVPAWFVPGLTAKPWWDEPDEDTGAAAEPPSLVELREVFSTHFMDLQGELIRLATLASRMQRDGGAHALPHGSGCVGFCTAVPPLTCDFSLQLASCLSSRWTMSLCHLATGQSIFSTTTASGLTIVVSWCQRSARYSHYGVFHARRRVERG